MAEARRTPAGPPQGSVAEAVEAWLRSPEFKANRPRTQDQYERYSQALRQAKNIPLAKLRRSTILDWRDVVAEASGHGAAASFIATVRSFLSWCVNRDKLDANPALRIRKIGGGSYPAWTEAEAQRAMKVFPEAARRAVVLAYHLGQRRGDLTLLRWATVDLEGRRIRLQQEKGAGTENSKEWMTLPIPPALHIELTQWKRAPLGADAKRGTTMLASTGHVLTTATGRPWEREYLSRAIQEAVVGSGMRPGLNLHGLRKLRAASLAESGASTKEIAAVTGHKTLSMVAHYAASADQEKLASAAIIRLNTKQRKKKA